MNPNYASIKHNYWPCEKWQLHHIISLSIQIQKLNNKKVKIKFEEVIFFFFTHRLTTCKSFCFHHQHVLHTPPHGLHFTTTNFAIPDLTSLPFFSRPTTLAPTPSHNFHFNHHHLLPLSTAWTSLKIRYHHPLTLVYQALLFPFNAK